MKPLRRAIVGAIVLSAALLGAPPVGSAGSRYFEEADRSLISGVAANAVGLAEKGWAAVKAAGPADPGFLEGVSNAFRIFAVLGRDLRAEAVYTEAEGLCATPGLEIVRLRLQYMQADDLIRNSQYVKAEAVLRSSLAMENSAAHKSALYVAFLQSLAMVREQEGDLGDAEALYRVTIGYPKPDLSAVVIQRFSFGKLPLPFIGEPRLSMAAFYSNHGRLADAEALYREQLAQGAQTGDERLGAMRQLAGFLSVHGSKTEALAIEEQILGLREAQASATPESENLLANERNTLAQMEAAAGRGEDAKALLEQGLKQAELQHGKNSREYGYALSNLFENRRTAGDYDAAEKLARENVRRTENAAAEPDERVSAVFRLAEVRGAQGHVAEADALTKRAVEMNRAAHPQSPLSHTAQFEQAEALVRRGKPEEAVRVAREIADGPEQRDSDDQFGFRHLAQSMATDYKAGAAQVASLGVLWVDRRLAENLHLTSDLTGWAGFYRYALGQPDRTRDLLTRAETTMLACCGTASPWMEGVVQERAWLAAATDGDAPAPRSMATVAGKWNKSTLDLAAAHERAADWPGAARLNLKAVDISTRRTGAFGHEYVNLLDSIAMHFLHHGDTETALVLNQRAIDHARGLVNSDVLRQSLEKHREEIRSRR